MQLINLLTRSSVVRKTMSCTEQMSLHKDGLIYRNIHNSTIDEVRLSAVVSTRMYNIGCVTTNEI